MNRNTRVLLLMVLILPLYCPPITHGAEQGIPVLMYHDVLPAAEHPGETVISLDKFDSQMRYLYEHGYTTLSMDELVSYMKGGPAPAKAVVLTIDDGWQSVREVTPILKKYHFKASFWIFPQKGIGYPYLDWKDLFEIAEDPDFEIGAHSLSHPWDHENLRTWAEGETPGKTLKDAAYEVMESKRILEKALHRKVRYFAWPCGEYNDALVQIAKEAGYEGLLTVEGGANLPGDDVYRIKRIFINGTCSLEMFEATLQECRGRICTPGGQNRNKSLTLLMQDQRIP